VHGMCVHGHLSVIEVDYVCMVCVCMAILVKLV